MWARMGGWLWSWSMLECWRKGVEWKEAECQRGHRIPDERCMCGLWAYNNLEAMEKDLGVAMRGARGEGQWLWKLPVVDLVEDDKGYHRAAKDAEPALNSNNGILNHKEGHEEREFRVDREGSLRMPHAGNEPVKDARSVKDARVPALEQSGGLNHGGVPSMRPSALTTRHSGCSLDVR